MDKDQPRITDIEAFEEPKQKPQDPQNQEGQAQPPSRRPITMEPEVDDYSATPSQVEQDSGLNAAGGSGINEGAPVAARKKGKMFLWLTLAVFLLFGAGAGGYYYYKIHLPSLADHADGEVQKADFDLADTSGLVKKLPDELVSINNPEFIKAVNMFKAGYLEAARARFQEVVESSATPVEKSYSMVYLGAIADEDEKYRLALDYYQRAVKFYPENFYAHYNMALTYRRIGKYLDAIEELKIAQKINPNLIDIGVLKGELQYEMSDLPGAQKTLEEIVDREEDALAFYNLGLVYKKDGKLAQAKAAFMRALEAPGSPEAVYKSAAQLGIIYGTQGDFPNAIVHMKRALQLQPKNSKYWYNLALLQQKGGRSEDALVSLRESLKHGDENPHTYIYISQLYEELGKTSHAEEAMLRARENAPMDVEILQRLADIQIKNSRWDDANETLRQILQISTRSYDRSRALFNLGKVYMEVGDYPNAEKSLTQARAIDFTNEDILLSLGNLYHLQGDSHQTIELYREALKINPDSTALLKALGTLYYKLALYTEAEQTFRQLAAHPLKNELDLHFAYHALGKILKGRGLFDDSIEYFEKSLKSSDIEMQYDSLMEMGDAYLEANRPSVFAIESFEKAIALKPGEYGARAMLAKALMRDGSASARQRAEEELSMVIELSRDAALLSKAHTLRGVIYYSEGFYLRSIDDFNIALEFDPSNQEAFQNKKAAAQRIEAEF